MRVPAAWAAVVSAVPAAMEPHIQQGNKGGALGGYSPVFGVASVCLGKGMILDTFQSIHTSSYY